jgi:hypothetical protein
MLPLPEVVFRRGRPISMESKMAIRKNGIPNFFSHNPLISNESAKNKFAEIW